jgi:4-hydroxy-3-methylbut-2-enyl diphosphate reductase
MSIPPENVYVFGEIIHNPDVVRAIADRGITTVTELSEVPNGATLIIRSHGVGRAVYEECERRKIAVVDCTCEFVHRSQRIVDENYLAGNAIVIVGERSHPEVMGLNGWCNGEAFIFSSETDDFSVLPDKKCVVIAQTTYSEEKFVKIIKNIGNNGQKTLVIFKTICYTTIGRQNEARELAAQCDAMLVIGGLNSSNTNKLFDICKEYCEHVIRLERIDDLKYKTIERFKKVGIVTGASTPNAQTQEVLLKMEKTQDNATMEEVVAAAKIANADQFINKMDKGYYTHLSDRGMSLSGGERQRLCIARAVLKNPEILLLDEATSALDTQNEHEVQAALTSLMKNRTSIVIAHRLNTVMNADKILVMDKGVIVESGTHKELIEKGGLYADLYKMYSFTD